MGWSDLVHRVAGERWLALTENRVLCQRAINIEHINCGEAVGL
jgi:hypothetical protein